MILLEELYNEKFYTEQVKSKKKSYSIIANNIKELLNPTTIIDVGCGDGILMKYLDKQRIKTHGIEGSPHAKTVSLVPTKTITTHDLRTPYRTTKTYDLVISIEVAEHIEPEHVEAYLNTITKLGDKIYLTAAPPGQPGTGHVNCQPKSYWINKFSLLGYDYCKTLTEQFVTKQKQEREITKSYLWKNLMIFSKRNS